MSDWKEVKLEEITTKIGDGLHGTPVYDDNGEYHFINGNNLLNGKIVIKEETRRVNKEEFLKYSKELNERSILVSINGTIGNLAYFKNEKCVLGKSACYINVRDGVNQKFIYYNFLNNDFQTYLIEIATGTTIPNVPLKGIREYSLRLPPLAEQNNIAEILSSLDEKIDLLNRQNKTLEQLSETLFRKWFVDEAQEVWEETKLSNFISIKHGYAFKGNYITDEPCNLTLVTPGNFRIGGGFKSYKFKYYTDNNFPSEYIFQTGDLVVTMTDLSVDGDTLGYAALIPESSNGNAFLHNQRVGKVEFLKNIGKYFVYYLMRTKEYHWYILGGASGTAIRHTSPTSICSYLFKMPPINKLNDFESFVEQLELKIKRNQTQIKTLTQLRDILLPKLMSGDVRIS